MSPALPSSFFVGLHAELLDQEGELQKKQEKISQAFCVTDHKIARLVGRLACVFPIPTGVPPVAPICNFVCKPNPNNAHNSAELYKQDIEEREGLKEDHENGFDDG